MHFFNSTITRQCLWIALAMGAAAALLCAAARSTQAAPAPDVMSLRVQSRQEVSNASNAFAMDMYRQLLSSNGDHNLFFSPLSIDQAMAMVYSGAAGQTAKQMGKALRYSDLSQDNPAFVQMGFSELDQLISPSAENGQGEDQAQPFKLMTANALFGQEGFPFNANYLAVLKNDYQAPLQEVNFSKDKSAAVQKINQWVAGQTNDKITDLLSPASVAADTQLILVNAIYFKANWSQEFQKGATEQAPFHAGGADASKKDVNVPMMHLRHSFRYGENDQCQYVELPYKGNDVSMLLLVPKKVDGLAALEKNLTLDSLQKMMLSSGWREVELSMPRFKITDSLNLSSDLSALGMPNAFDSSADFSGISSKGLYINKVIQQAYVAVDESGAEAAAATAIMMRPTAIRARPEVPVVVNADHPFMFVIMYRNVGAMLFIGRVVNPA